MFCGRQILISFVLILFLSAFARCSCSGDDSPQIPNRAVTNSLIDSQPLDLVLDAIGLEIFVNDSLEIHIMDENEETLLACVGSRQNGVLSYLYLEQFYALMNAQFLVGQDVTLTDDTLIVLKLISKNQVSCPSGFNADTDNPASDVEITKLSLNYGDLFAGPINFSNYATAYFRKEADSPLEVEVAADTPDGDLAINQIYLPDPSLNIDETSLPEFALFIAKYGSFEMVACLELGAIEDSGALFAELEHKFLNGNGQTMTMDDFPASDDYWIIFAELDEERCPDPQSLEGLNNDILGTTGKLSVSDFLDEIPFDEEFGYVNLYLN